MNTIIAQFKAKHESGLVSKGISAWSAFTCFVYSLWTRQKVETEAESHSEIGWKLSALRFFLRERTDILQELIQTVPGFSTAWHDGQDTYLFFSAASRMGGGINRAGTRFIMAEDLLNHPERWRLLGKDQSPQACWQSFMRCWNQRGRDYDWWGIAGFGMPFGWLCKKAGEKIWYCSEIVYYAIYNKIERISPRRLGWFAKKDGWVEIGDGAAITKKQ